MAKPKRIHLSAALALAGLFAVSEASGISLDLSDADGFNLLVWGDAALINSDTEGTVAVGGNATFDSYSVGEKSVNADPTQGALVVGGDLSAGNGQVKNGSVYVGGNYSGPGYSLNSMPGSVTQSGLDKSGVGFDFDAAQTAFSARSQAYGSAAANGTSVLQWSTLTLTGANSDLNIFNISAGDLASATALNIFVPDAAKALINVSGSIADFSSKGIGGNFSGQDTLFNFHEAAELNISGISIIGSVLAPFADVNFQNGQLNGQLIANSFSGASWGVGQVNYSPFNGDEPEEATRVPDSGRSLTLLLGGISLLVVIHRLLASGKSAA